MRKRLLIAAAALLTAGSLFAWLKPSSSARFGEIQAAMKATRSVSCRQVIRTKGKPDETTQIRILESGLWRADSSDGSYTIVETKKSQSLAVDPTKKTALLVLGANVPPINLYETIKGLPADKKARPLPGKKIDGKKVTKTEDIEVGGLPEAAQFTPDGKYILVGNFLDQDFSILKVNGTKVTDTGKRFKVPGHPASARMSR